MVYGKKAGNKAKDILSTSFKLLNEGCINQIPEILDGDYPHDQKGCYAQAWGITELYRVSELLNMI
jgi:glycogen debranching enzyme